MNEAPLLQSGRSRLDFLVTATRALNRLHGTVKRQVDSLHAFLGKAHGRAARIAFDQIASTVTPMLEELGQKGPATLRVDPELAMPDYYRGVWFHCTQGGWDGHEQQGYIHGEIVHRLYVGWPRHWRRTGRRSWQP